MLIKNPLTVIQSGGGGGGTVGLNIEYSLTEPTDHSKIWVKCAQPESVLFDKIERVGENCTTLNAKLSAANALSAACSVGTDCYVFAGNNSNGFVETVQKFNTIDNTIATVATFPTGMARMNFAVCAVGTDCYIFGGAKDLQNYKFNTLTNEFSELSGIIVGKQLIAACAVGTDCYIFGGINNSDNTFTDIIQKYDTLTNTLTTLSVQLPFPCAGLTACAVKNNCYIFGGAYVPTGVKNIILKYDTTTNTLTTLNSHLINSGMYISSCTDDINCYIFGGNKSDNCFNSIQKYDIISNVCSILSVNLAYEMCAISAAKVGNSCYLFGGLNNEQTYFDIIQKFDIGEMVLQHNVGKIIVGRLPDQTGDLINTDEIQYKLYGMQFYLGNSDNHAELIESKYYDETAQAWVSTN